MNGSSRADAPASPALLIYGVSGYTGRLLSAYAAERGVAHWVAGRDAASVMAHGARVGQPARVFALEDPAQVRQGLLGVRVVLNAAGPFRSTQRALIEGALAVGAHYLDLAGEVPEFERAWSYDERARQRGVMVMPGVGMGVVPTDVVAKKLSERMPEATHLELGFATRGGVSRGTLETLLSDLRSPGVRRERGELVRAQPGERVRQVVTQGRRRVLTLNPWRADLWSAWRSTGIPTITTWTALPAPLRWMMRGSARGAIWRARATQRMIRAMVHRLPAGPSPGQLERGRVWIWGQVSDAQGHALTLELQGPDAYLLTAQTALLIAQRALGGEASPGAQTPTSAYTHTLLDDHEPLSWTWRGDDEGQP